MRVKPLLSLLCLVLMTLPTVAAEADGPVAVPPSLEAKEVQPLTGEALEGATLPLDEVIEALPRPAFLPESPPDREETEPPLEAQEAYVAGRLALRQNRVFEALRQLQAAERLAPDRPALLRLLGRIYAAAGNRVLATQYLEKTVRLTPDDPQAVYLLSDARLEDGQHEEAAAGFREAERLVRERPADAATTLLPLIRYGLFQSLRSLDRDLAAATELERFLEMEHDFSRAGVGARELMVIDRQQGQLLQTLGDLYNRVGQPEAALDAYEKALATDDAGEHLDARLVYTQLLLGQPERARDLVVAAFRHAGEDQDRDLQSLELVQYLLDAGIAPETMTKELEEAYEQREQPSELAVALAAILPPEQGRELLEQHLKTTPSDQRAFRSLVDRLLKEPEGTNAAVTLTAGLIEQHPERAAPLVAELLEAVEVPLAVMEAAPADTAAGALIRGMTFIAVGNADEAREALRGVIEREPTWNVARVELAKLLLNTGKADEAATVLDPIEPPLASQPEVLELRVRVLTESGQAERALELVEGLLEETPAEASSPLVLLQARLQKTVGRVNDAVQTLQDAINVDPTNETLYAYLFELLDGDPTPDDTTRIYQQMMRRMLSTIPTSRTARLKLAELHEVRREWDRAETLLKQLLRENPADREAWRQLLRVYFSSQQHSEAVDLLDGRLDEIAGDRDMLAGAQRAYSGVSDLPRMLEVTRMLLAQEPAGPSRVRMVTLATSLLLAEDEPNEAMELLEGEKLLLAEGEERGQEPLPDALVPLVWRVLEAAGQPERARRELERTIREHPDQEAMLRYQLSALLDRQGDVEASRRELETVVANTPDFSPALNGLAYRFAMDGVQLDRALDLVDRALEQEPDSAAYLDTKGWILYKLGRFDEAIRWLTRSSESEGGAYPVIFDHLGDAYHQQGKTQEAKRAWQRASELFEEMGEMELAEDSELEGLPQRLEAKLAAIEAGEPPDVATVAAEENE